MVYCMVYFGCPEWFVKWTTKINCKINHTLYAIRTLEHIRSNEIKLNLFESNQIQILLFLVLFGKQERVRSREKGNWHSEIFNVRFLCMVCC